MVLECLENIIGLSETTCECTSESKPSDADTSASGVFLDQLEGFNIDLAAAADDCNRDGIWTRMDRAVRNAKLDLQRDLLGCIGGNYKPRIESFMGQLGDSAFQGSLNLTTPYAGIYISPFEVKGAYMTVKKIGVLINQNAPVTVQIWSNENTSTKVFETLTPISAIQDTLTWGALTTPLELPMWSFNGIKLKYYVVMVLDGTFQPKANKRDCGCGGVQRPYLKWLDFGGIKGSNTSNLSAFASTTELNGIVLDVDIKCKTSEVICSSEKPLDFENDENAMYLAYAIRFRAGARLFEELKSTGRINRFSLLNGEFVNAKIDEWNKAYMDCINYLCAKSAEMIGINDCLICRDTKTTLLKNTILS